MKAETIKPLFSEQMIRKRVAELGLTITEDYRETQQLTVLCVLKGAFIFTADLVRNIRVPCTIEFLRASSYGNMTSSSGEVFIQHDLDISNKDVLLIEDIVDSGLTLLRIIGELELLGPSSLKVCALLDKPAARRYPVTIHYRGFSIQNVFVVGYGLDAGGKYRELPFIGTLGQPPCYS